jgi:ribonuclease R
MQYYPKYFDYNIVNDESVSFKKGTFLVDEIYRDGYVLLENNSSIKISDGLQGINRAFHNNKVVVKLNKTESENNGEVIKTCKIIYCQQEQLINLPGVLKLDSQTIHGVSKKKQRIYPFKPFDIKYPEFMVPSNLPPGPSVYATINFEKWTEESKYPQGMLSILIGPVDILENQQKIMLYKYNLNPKKLHLDEKVISQLKTPLNLSSDCERVNYKDCNIMSIDPENCIDVDDSFHLQINNINSNYQIVVHIADVSSLMRVHTSFDNLISKRAFSIYFPGCNKQINMLPDKLVINSLSLNKDFERQAVSVVLEFDSNYLLVKNEVHKSIIINKNQLSYEEAQKIIDKKPVNKFRKNIKLLSDLNEVHVILQKFKKNNKIESLNKFLDLQSDEIDSHEIVQILMVLTNYIVGEKLLTKEFSIFRKHESKQVEHNQLNLIKNIENKELTRVYSNFQSNKASYTIVEKKDYDKNKYSHSALGLEHYTHFTSPIRRYFDVLVHRLLFEECSLEDFKNKIQLINNIELQMKRYDKNALRLFKISTMPKTSVEMKVYIIDFDISGKINVWIPDYNLIETIRILPKEIIEKVKIEIFGQNNEYMKVSNENGEITLKIFQDVILNLLPNLKEPNPKYKLKKSFVNPDFLTLIS